MGQGLCNLCSNHKDVEEGIVTETAMSSQISLSKETAKTPLSAGDHKVSFVSSAADMSPHQTTGEEAEAMRKLTLKLKSFVVEVHGATLMRSFSRFGSMHVYAILFQGSAEARKECCRTQPVKGKAPAWEQQYEFTEVPESISLSLYDKNEFHRDVLCGSMTLPCSPDMDFDRQDFQLEKKHKATGHVCLTIKAHFEQVEARAGSETQAHMSHHKTGLGGEFDNMMDALEPAERRKGRVKTVIALAHDHADDDHEHDHEDEAEESQDHAGVEGEGRPTGLVRAESSPSADFEALPLLGSWECVATQGLEEFMIKSGIGVFQRKIAKAARWPMWEFSADGKTILFSNHSAIGILKEDILIGQEYHWTDGKNNEWTCKATWTRSQTGGTLHIARAGSLGDYEELRVVDGDKLEFTLKNPTYKASWGRSFVRKPD